MKRIIGISVFIVLLIVGTIVWLMNDSTKKTVDPKSYFSNWDKTYVVDDYNPGGLAFYMELLKAYTQDSVYVAKKWSDLDSLPQQDSANYIFIGEQFGLSDLQMDSLTQLADSGATVFIASTGLTTNVYQRFFKENAYNWDFNNRFFAYIRDTTYSFYRVFQNDTIYDDWYSFEENQIIDSNYRATLFAMKHPFAFYCKQNKGEIHFHINPYLFQNVQVLQPNGLAHASALFPYLQKNKATIFLSCADYLNAKKNEYLDDGDDDGTEEDTSLLQFILSNRTLRIAFLLAIGLLILYVIFRGKRRENILVGYPDKKNQSLPYVETLASIYLTKNSPIDVRKLLRKNFFFNIQRFYNIDLSKLDQLAQSTKMLSEKLPHSAEKLQQLINELTSNKIDVTDALNASIYSKIQTFYQENQLMQGTQSFAASTRIVNIEKSLPIGLIGLLLGLVLGVRGLALLSSGVGLGILLVMLAGVLLFFASRFISRPYLTIHQDKLEVYGLFFGKKVISLKQNITIEVNNSTLSFTCEDGLTINLHRAILSKKSEVALKQFVEHIKQTS